MFNSFKTMRLHSEIQSALCIYGLSELEHLQILVITGVGDPGNNPPQSGAKGPLYILLIIRNM